MIVFQSFGFAALPGDGSNKTDGLAQNVVVTKPSGTVDGDFLLAIYGQESEAAAGFGSLPAGFTEFITANPSGVSGHHGRAGWKIASGEGSDYTFSCTDDATCFVLRFSGVRTASPINVSNHTASGTGTDSTPQSPSITTTVANAYVIFGLSWAADAVSELVAAPADTVEIAQGDDAGGRPAMVLYGKTQAAAGATGTGDWQTAAADRFLSFSIALVPSIVPQVFHHHRHHNGAA